ncbi:Ribosomal protein L22, bacterial/chloroplast-type [Artemisia annua]|uniref:Large ribosomal subunit protein uL22c n=1 Tax=Artemisia annua TaxID=35608 RepID=A0A2U1LZS0_ARTAN|nr:Ribosomal protein L22, bacterial/chloroplast-type [Artemisia annua]
MVGWHRHVQSLIRQLGKRVENSCHTHASFSSSPLKLSPVQGLPGHLQGLWVPSTNVTRPIYHYFQQLGFTSSRRLLSSEAAAGPSPLTPTLAIGSGQTEAEKAISKPATVQAILKKIKQSPKKVNLVATLVRGMRVEDALLQLQLTVKRASKTVYQVIHSARANATHNYGFDADRLIVAEAFVGKGFFKKRVSYHAKGRSGVRVRAECRLTVVLREITPEEEAEIARLKVHNFAKLTKRERRLVPHKLIETTPIWNRKGKARNHGEEAEAMAA